MPWENEEATTVIRKMNKAFIETSYTDVLEWKYK